MAGGFADADPSSLLNAFTAWDRNKYDQAVDVGERRRAFLDDQAIRLQNTTSQLQMFYNDEAPKIAEELSAKLGNQWAALGEPERKNAVDEEFMNRNYDMLKPVVDETLTTNPHAIKAFGEVVGKHRAFKQMRRVTGKDGTVRYVVDVENANTGTTGPLDDTEDGVDTSKNKDVGVVGMSGSGMLNNILMLGENAALGRGQMTASALDRGLTNRTGASNAANEEKRKAALSQVPSLSAAQTGALEDGSQNVQIYDVAGGGGLSTGVSAGGGGSAPVAQVPAQPASLPGAVRDTSGDAPAGKTAAQTTPASEGVVPLKPADSPITTFAKNAGAKKAVADAADNERWLAAKATEDGGGTGWMKSLASGTKQLNSQYDVNKRGEMSSRLSAQIDFMASELKRRGYGAEAALNRGLHPDIAAELGRRMGAPPVANKGAAKAGTNAGAQVDPAQTSALAAAAQAAGLSVPRFLETPAGRDYIKVFEKNFKTSDIEAMNKAIVNLTADGNALTKLTPKQSFAFAALQRMGAPGYTMDDITKIQQGRLGGPNAADALAKTTADNFNRINNSEVTVGTGIAQQNMQNRQSEVNARISAAASGGKPPEDKTTDNFRAASETLFQNKEFDLETRNEVVGLVVGSLDKFKQMGYYPGYSQEHAIHVLRKASEMIKNYKQKNKAPGWKFWADDPKLADLTPEIYRALVAPQHQAAYAEYEKVAKAANPNATPDAIMAAFVKTHPM